LSVHGKLLRFRRPEHETLEMKQGGTRAGAPACESGASNGRGKPTERVWDHPAGFTMRVWRIRQPRCLEPR
jgi:hypothetical protein